MDNEPQALSHEPSAMSHQLIAIRHEPISGLSGPRLMKTTCQTEERDYI
jgi:hypothetical protein